MPLKKVRKRPILKRILHGVGSMYVLTAQRVQAEGGSDTGFARCIRCCAHPLKAMVMTTQAMIVAVRPIITVKTNMASSSYDSSAKTVSALLAMKIIPPLTKQKEVMSSVGGLVGR